MSEQNKELVRSYLDEVWAKGNIEGTDSFFTPGYRRHVGPNVPALDIKDQANRLHGIRSAFPDVALQIEDMLAEGNLVAFRFTMSGTHQGTFQGLEPSGTPITATGVDIVRIEDGRLAEHWGGVDVNSIVQQLKAATS